MYGLWYGHKKTGTDTMILENFDMVVHQQNSKEHEIRTKLMFNTHHSRKEGLKMWRRGNTWAVSELK